MVPISPRRIAARRPKILGTSCGGPSRGPGTLGDALTPRRSARAPGAYWRSGGFLTGDDLGLLQHELGGCLFLVGRVSVTEQQPLDRRAQLCPNLFLDGPVGLRVAADDLDEFVGDLLQCLVARRHWRACIVSGGEPGLLKQVSWLLRQVAHTAANPTDSRRLCTHMANVARSKKGGRRAASPCEPPA